MQKDAKIVFILILLFSSISFAQEIDDLTCKSLSLDECIITPVPFGDFELKLPYLFISETMPLEGYMLNLASLAKLKLVIDESQSDTKKLLDKIKKQAAIDLSTCQKDSTSRVESYKHNNELLQKDKTILEKKLKSAQTDVYVYAGISAFSAVLITFLTLKIM